MTNKQKNIESQKWDAILFFFQQKFSDGEAINLDGILFLIGVQELGKGFQKFKKDEKLHLMHIAVCRVLEPFGFYQFDYVDNDGWPHYQLIEELPKLSQGEQTVFMKRAIIQYFEEKAWLEKEFLLIEQQIFPN